MRDRSEAFLLAPVLHLREDVVPVPEFHFAFPEPSPEEKEAMKEQADRQTMAVQALIHEHVRFFEELTADQALTLHRMIHQASHSPQDAFEWVNMMEGYTASLLTHRHGHCPCGEDHDKELAQALSTEDQKEASGAEDQEGCHLLKWVHPDTGKCEHPDHDEDEDGDEDG